MAAESGTGYDTAEPRYPYPTEFVECDRCYGDGEVEPAETLPELVDAIRQDTAGIGACVSSIRFIASTRGDVPKSVMEWVDRLSAHADRLESKCALALTGDEHGR